MKREKVGERGANHAISGFGGPCKQSCCCSLGHDNKLAVSNVPTPFFRNQEGPGVSKGTLVGAPGAPFLAVIRGNMRMVPPNATTPSYPFNGQQRALVCFA